MNKTTLKTQETFAKPTEWLKKRGCTKIGYITEIEIEQAEKAVRISSGSVVKYYSKKGVEITPNMVAVTQVPYEFLNAVIGELSAIRLRRTKVK